MKAFEARLSERYGELNGLCCGLYHGDIGRGLD